MSFEELLVATRRTITKRKRFFNFQRTGKDPQDFYVEVKPDEFKVAEGLKAEHGSPLDLMRYNQDLFDKVLARKSRKTRPTNASIIAIALY